MNINLNIPQSWNALSPTVLQKIAWYFHIGLAQKKLDLYVYFALADVKWWQLKKAFNVLKLLKLVPLDELKNHFAFIYETQDLTKFLPSITANDKKLKAPGDRLHNITIEEFALCEDFFFHYTQTNNLEYIRYIVAVLYRATSSGKKQPFDKSTLELSYINLKGHVSKKQLSAIALSYKGSTLEIQSNKAYAKIFIKPKGTKTNTVQKKATAPGWERLVLDLSGGKFGNFEETNKTNIHAFLAEYTNLITNQPKN